MDSISFIAFPISNSFPSSRKYKKIQQNIIIAHCDVKFVHIPLFLTIIFVASIIYVLIFLIKRYYLKPFSELPESERYKELKDMLEYSIMKTHDNDLKTKLTNMRDSLKNEFDSNRDRFDYSLWLLDGKKNLLGERDLKQRINEYYTPSAFVSNHQGHLVMAILVIFSVMFVVTIENEYQPKNFMTSIFNASDSIRLFIDRESPLIIGTNSLFHDRVSQLKVTLFHNNSVKIGPVKLSPIEGSYLSFPNNNTLNLSENKSFKERPIDPSKAIGNTLNQPNSFANTTQKSESSPEVYQIWLNAKNIGFAQNVTEHFNLTITYFTSNDIRTLDIPISIALQFKDLPIVVYFLIVLLGVLISRIITIISAKIRLKLSAEYFKINLEEAMWIVFSIIIAVIGFTAFNETIKQFTANIFGNIAVAFGFGFSSEKILELARGFSSRFLPSPGEEATNS